MMESRTLLFLLGTFALASCKAFLPEVGLGIAKAATGRILEEEPLGAPFISNFIQEGTNVFYKPHFSMASHLEQPHAMVVENRDCNKTPLMPDSVLTTAVMEEPLKIVETVLPSSEFGRPHLKEVIEINPLTPDVVMPMPVAPAPVFAPEPTIFPEAPIFSSIPLPELPLPENEVLVPELPTLPMPIAPLPTSAVVEEPVMILEAPALPPFTMPELPVLTVVEAQPTPMPEFAIPVEPSAVMVEEPVFIPEAPILPPLKMPELPTIVEANPIAPLPTIIEEPMMIPEAPVLPTLVMPEIPAPFEEPAPMPIIPAMEPVVIPEAPVLPPFVMPELPNPPVHEVLPELSILAPFEQASFVVEEPAVIPEAPLLPPMTLSELPSPVVLEEKIPVKEIKIERPVLMPTDPFFPQQPCGFPFAPCPVEPYPHPIGVPTPYIPLADIPHPNIVPFMPTMHQMPIHSEKIEINKVIMSSLPSSLAFPTDCAQGIIAERILPHMIGQGIAAAPELLNPVPAPYIRL